MLGAAGSGAGGRSREHREKSRPGHSAPALWLCNSVKPWAGSTAPFPDPALTCAQLSAPSKLFCCSQTEQRCPFAGSPPGLWRGRELSTAEGPSPACASPLLTLQSGVWVRSSPGTRKVNLLSAKCRRQAMPKGVCGWPIKSSEREKGERKREMITHRRGGEGRGETSPQAVVMGGAAARHPPSRECHRCHLPPLPVSKC